MVDLLVQDNQATATLRSCQRTQEEGAVPVRATASLLTSNHGEGNWREEMPATVKLNTLGEYVGDYYFTDAPETYGYSTTLFNEIEE